MAALGTSQKRTGLIETCADYQPTCRRFSLPLHPPVRVKQATVRRLRLVDLLQVAGLLLNLYEVRDARDVT